MVPLKKKKKKKKINRNTIAVGIIKLTKYVCN